jgi:hypothetical protein
VVQVWVDNPQMNFGMAIVSEGQGGNSFALQSRNAPHKERAPRLLLVLEKPADKEIHWTARVRRDGAEEQRADAGVASARRIRRAAASLSPSRIVFFHAMLLTSANKGPAPIEDVPMIANEPPHPREFRGRTI